MHYEFDRVTLHRVIDGDTYDFIIDLGFNVVVRERFRLKGVDTPEIFRPSCEAEYHHGVRAKDYVEAVLTSAEGSIVLRSHKAGIYGRWEAEIYISGVSLADMLVENKYVKLTKEEYASQGTINGLPSKSTEEDTEGGSVPS